jgi:hypothetical protein
MSTTISEAARRWGVGRQTIYRRRRTGQLKFATTNPSTVKASEMLRVFGKPKPKSEKAATSGNIVALTRVEVVCEMLKAKTERLKAELATAKEELRNARAAARRERKRLLDLLSAQQRLIESQIGKSTLVPHQGEMTEAEAVLAAQQRVKSERPHRAR